MKPLSKRFSEIIGIVNVGRGDEDRDVWHEVAALEARIEALDGLMRFIPTIAHIVRAGHHRLAKVIDEETTDEEKVALIGFEEEVAALRSEEER